MDERPERRIPAQEPQGGRGGEPEEKLLQEQELSVERQREGRGWASMPLEEGEGQAGVAATRRQAPYGEPPGGEQERARGERGERGAEAPGEGIGGREPPRRRPEE